MFSTIASNWYVPILSYPPFSYLLLLFSYPLLSPLLFSSLLVSSLSIRYYIILPKLYNIIQYYTILYDTTRYDTILHDTLPFYTILYDTISKISPKSLKSQTRRHPRDPKRHPEHEEALKEYQNTPKGCSRRANLRAKGGQRHPNGANGRPKAPQKTSQKTPKAPQKTPLKRSGTRDPNLLSISWILMPLCSRLLCFDVRKKPVLAWEREAR